MLSLISGPSPVYYKALGKSMICTECKTALLNPPVMIIILGSFWLSENIIKIVEVPPGEIAELYLENIATVLHCIESRLNPSIPQP